VTGAALAVKFLLELCLLAAVAVWGVDAVGSTAAQVALGVAAPLAVAVVWGLFAAPKARRRLSLAPRLVLELGLFALGALALAAAGHAPLAVAFAAAVVLDMAALAALGAADA